MDNLWVIMPVYNEQDCVTRVLDEWLPILRQVTPGFTFCALNDGSKDRTLPILLDYAKSAPELKVIDKPNSGHGQTCIEGYRLAAEEGAAWILQIDSDGQCDPKFFPTFWKARERFPVIYGYRARRGDGIKRFLISRVVSLATWIATGIWVRDANVPYRLMRTSSVRSFLPFIPKDFHLANILLAALQQKAFTIHWSNIYFRQRMGGVPSIKAFNFGKQGLKLMKQLRACFRSHSLLGPQSGTLPVELRLDRLS